MAKCKDRITEDTCDLAALRPITPSLDRVIAACLSKMERGFAQGSDFSLAAYHHLIRLASERSAVRTLRKAHAGMRAAIERLAAKDGRQAHGLPLMRGDQSVQAEAANATYEKDSVPPDWRAMATEAYAIMMATYVRHDLCESTWACKDEMVASGLTLQIKHYQHLLEAMLRQHQRQIYRLEELECDDCSTSAPFALSLERLLDDISLLQVEMEAAGIAPDDTFFSTVIAGVNFPLTAKAGFLPARIRHESVSIPRAVFDSLLRQLESRSSTDATPHNSRRRASLQSFVRSMYAMLKVELDYIDLKNTRAKLSREQREHSLERVRRLARLITGHDPEFTGSAARQSARQQSKSEESAQVAYFEARIFLTAGHISQAITSLKRLLEMRADVSIGDSSRHRLQAEEALATRQRSAFTYLLSYLLNSQPQQMVYAMDVIALACSHIRWGLRDAFTARRSSMSVAPVDGTERMDPRMEFARAWKRVLGAIVAQQDWHHAPLDWGHQAGLGRAFHLLETTFIRLERREERLDPDARARRSGNGELKWRTHFASLFKRRPRVEGFVRIALATAARDAGEAPGEAPYSQSQVEPAQRYEKQIELAKARLSTIGRCMARLDAHRPAWRWTRAVLRRDAVTFGYGDDAVTRLMEVVEQFEMGCVAPPVGANLAGTDEEIQWTEKRSSDGTDLARMEVDKSDCASSTSSDGPSGVVITETHDITSREQDAEQAQFTWQTKVSETIVPFTTDSQSKQVPRPVTAMPDEDAIAESRAPTPASMHCEPCSYRSSFPSCSLTSPTPSPSRSRSPSPAQSSPLSLPVPSPGPDSAPEPEHQPPRSTRSSFSSSSISSSSTAPSSPGMGKLDLLPGHAPSALWDHPSCATPRGAGHGHGRGREHQSPSP